MSTKLFFFDLETTGVKFWKNGIHQISGMIVIDGKIEQEFDFKVKPNPKAEIEDKALEIAGVTREQIMQYPEMGTVYKMIVNKLEKYVDRFDKTDKFHLVGYNCAAFDCPFFRAFFTQNGDNYFGSWFWSASIDVMVLAAEKLKEIRPTMENFKLMTVAKQLGIAVDETKLHDAQYDIYLTKAIYDNL